MLWLSTSPGTICSFEGLDAAGPATENHRVVIPMVASPPGAERGITVATKERDVRTGRGGLTFRRYFTTEGTHPFDEVEWEIRDAVIPTHKDGGNAFEQ